MADEHEEKRVATAGLLIEYNEAHEVAKAATSVKNKAHTAAKNALVEYFALTDKPQSSEFPIATGYFTYGVGTSEKIDPRKWHDMLIEGEITEDQFYSCLSVGKAEAALIIGDDQVPGISVTTAGSTPSIKFTKGAQAQLPAPAKQITAKAATPAVPVLRKAARPVAPTVQPSARPGLRKITLRKPS